MNIASSIDDFGTGYSNFERIMELPFDIIKFDRSLVLASKTDNRSLKIVENLAHLFDDMNYSVLYEGVEDEQDEKRRPDRHGICRNAASLGASGAYGRI